MASDVRKCSPHITKAIAKAFASLILNLESKYGRERLETAVRLARQKYRRPTSPQIRAILENAADLEYKRKIQTAPDRSSEKSYTRGAEYYAEKERPE